MGKGVKWLKIKEKKAKGKNEVPCIAVQREPGVNANVISYGFPLGYICCFVAPCTGFAGLNH